jgi:hypothetical protein
MDGVPLGKEVGGMEPVALIVAALAAGAAAAPRDGAGEAVKSAYARLRLAARKRFKDPANGEYVLEKHAAAPEIWRSALQQELAESGAGADTALIEAAQGLMRLLDAHGTQAGKYVVSVQGSQGVQVGDHNTQANYFYEVNAGRDAYVAGRDLRIDPQ